MREIGTGVNDVQYNQIGPYEVVMLLGQGGMGRVFRARRPFDQASVAIKVMSGDLLNNPEIKARFKQETESLIGISHSNLARVLDNGMTEDGTPFIVMEFVDGPSLADLIRNRMEMPYSRIANLMVQAAQGLDAAFKHKIIHRDVKPANLMLGIDGVLKIVDFGLARNLFDTSSKAAENLLGTPRYMAPEQVRGQSVDHRTDMYSLGASFYHLITGQPPFEAETPQALMMKHIQSPLVPLYVINPEVPADLSEVIHRLMAKDPADRYQEYDDLIAALREVEMTRLAKEKAREQALAEKSRVEEPPTLIPPDETTSARHDAQPVNVDATKPRILEALEYPEEQKKSGIFLGPWILVALFLLGLGIATLLLRESTDKAGVKRSGWAVLIGRVIGKDEKALQQEQANEYLEQLRSNVTRMQTVQAIVVEYELQKKEFPRDTDDLLQSGLAKPDDLLDAWDRPMQLYPLKKTIVSLGEDGESSSDDFIINSQGKFIAEPVALKELQAQSGE